MNAILRCLALIGLLILATGCGQQEREAVYTGSESCRECHEKFYKLWAPSHHGKAMQPYTRDMASSKLTPQKQPIVIGDKSFIADIEKGVITETGPGGMKEYSIEHVMGGKNVYFFLVPMERGRLQVAPISYNVRTVEWYDTTASMVRHFGLEEDEAIHWTDSLLTFNTACFNCHVSQLSKNYDLETDTYNTVWGEPGINCEACHGPASEHIRVCRKANGEVPEDIKLLSWKTLSTEQKNQACAVCHAKMSSLTKGFHPGDRFFDHYDLICLEDRDFYPDGRDLGENYTYTLWMMSPCAENGKLDCMHCHTSSGRFRQKDNPNAACMPCHKDKADDIKGHSHHKLDKDDSPTCVSCHMPMTIFGQMARSDHSMRPPVPEATLRFKSPNACNMCHKDKDAAWAAENVKKWHPERKWSDRIQKEGMLVQWAREGKWEHLDKISGYIGDKESDVIVTTSLVRLMYACRDMSKVPVLKEALKHESPLVRAAAATALGAYDVSAIRSLLPLLKDEYRLVRVRAASELAGVSKGYLSAEEATLLAKVERELVESLTCRPDHWSSHYNMGNYHGQKQEVEKSLASYELAIKFRPDIIIPYVNASIAASRLGDSEKAYRYLKKAVEIEPENGAVNLNLGMLTAERKDLESAEKYFRTALKDSGTMSRAAYNLAVIVGEKDPDQAVKLCEQALKAEPANMKYRQALEYYSRKTAE